ncbi:indolepyruvate oxidoreductase subunit beta [Desulfonatronovibrio magnus]|uniref:indolepyruvate oxidoreductase subunit beta n=1 Tax=Desulfonatronovibrio magnus TaxID=698827 RepID=UPI0005EACF20|nr:indolepyruvate oxidoreductase subunit beta [Desulfonatronovibrio magnus]
MKTIRVMIVAVGGQGNILAARVLGETAVAAGIDVRMSEFHGMAQRGGVVESMVLLGDGTGYCIADGEADVLLGFEPSETIRAAAKCSSSSIVITNTVPLPPFTVAMGQAQYPQMPESLKKLASRVQNLIMLDALKIATEAGSPLAVNMAMLGALAGTGILPMEPDLFCRIIEEKTKKRFVEINLKAFQAGMMQADNTRS